MTKIRAPRKSPIATRSLPPLGNGIELTVWESPFGNYAFELEDWQVDAIQQVLGIYLNSNGDIVHLSEAEVKKRIEKIGRIAIEIDEK